MVFKLEFRREGVVKWSLTPDGVQRSVDAEYRPTLYISGPSEEFPSLSGRLTELEPIHAVRITEQFTSLRETDQSEVLAIDLDVAADPRHVAGRVRSTILRDIGAPGQYQLFNVDIAPQFRYCLERGLDPSPTRPVSTTVLKLDEQHLAHEDVTELTVDGDEVPDDEVAALQFVGDTIREADPDAIVVSHGELVPLLIERARAIGDEVDLQLGREAGYERLARQSTYDSYGRVGNSPARYDVPGRVIIDISNSFLWSESGLEGLIDLVEKSHKPLQELGWASIGNVFTSIQIRHAFDREVLVPWRSWETESFKDFSTLHAADRGGFTISPEVGLHEDVYEVDFSSLYPNIMVEHNISPDSILCDCHSDREDIPELGYNVCDEEGFLTDVLEPLLADREAIKQEIREADPEEDISGLKARSGAIKWILVSCFGYQGFKNAKFGRIECHEAINAVARDVLLNAKTTFEDHGWAVVHAIVDSVWVTPRDDVDEVTPVGDVIEMVSEDAGITLDFEDHYEWVSFVPRRDSKAGALTKYFGKVADREEFKVRGIETRQRSTPAFISTAQEEMLECLDSTRDPQSVIDKADLFIDRLEDGDVEPAQLVETVRASKPLSEYTQSTLTVAALERYESHDVTKHPGEDVRYIVVDDDAAGQERVRLPFENVDAVDVGYYENLLERAVESVVSPLGWTREDIRQYRADVVDRQLTSY